MRPGTGPTQSTVHRHVPPAARPSAESKWAAGGDNRASVYIGSASPYDGQYAIAECNGIFESNQRDAFDTASATGWGIGSMHDDSIAIEHGNASESRTGSVRVTEHSSRPAPVPHDPALARFYMTSDLRAATSLTRTHLDFYLREGVILPTARTESGYLLFDDGELGTLRQVIAWRQEGIGIREIRARLNRSRPGEEGMTDGR